MLADMLHSATAGSFSDPRERPLAITWESFGCKTTATKHQDNRSSPLPRRIHPVPQALNIESHWSVSIAWTVSVRWCRITRVLRLQALAEHFHSLQIQENAVALSRINRNFYSLSNDTIKRDNENRIDGAIRWVI